jgi:hypothetical protein
MINSGKRALLPRKKGLSHCWHEAIAKIKETSEDVGGGQVNLSCSPETRLELELSVPSGGRPMGSKAASFLS